MASGKFHLYSKETGEGDEISEFLFLRLIQITYVRDKRFCELLITKYEKLTQKKFDMAQLTYK